jgi:hypothetical protein
MCDGEQGLLGYIQSIGRMSGTNTEEVRNLRSILETTQLQSTNGIDFKVSLTHTHVIYDFNEECTPQGQP